jgi:hypothetical protein
VIYERESKTPTQKLHAAIKEGDPIWVRNPDPNDKGWDEGETFWHSFLDISEDQSYVMQEAAMEGTIMGEDVEPEDLDDLVAKGYLKDMGGDEFEPTDWGAMVGTLLFGHDGEHRGGGPGIGGRYRGHGGADDEFQCYVEAIQTPGDPNSLVAVHDVNSGESYVLPMAYLTRYPTPAKSDWKGGFSEDLRKDHTQPDGRSSTADTARERRDRGRQLRHWVNGKVNPEFSEWLMGFPAGHFDAGFAPDDYKPT